jgi:N-acetylglutamate synthase-like GNAT family acetyltransferase
MSNTHFIDDNYYIIDDTNYKNKKEQTLLKQFYYQILFPEFLDNLNELECYTNWTKNFFIILDTLCTEVEEIEEVDKVEEDDRIWTSTKITKHTMIPIILGGLVCQYYPQSNVWLLSYLAVDSIYQGHGIAKNLIKQMVKKIKTNTNDTFIVVETQESKQIIFEKCGFTYLDFDYIQPRLSIDKEINSNSLTERLDLFLIEHYNQYKKINFTQINEKFTKQLKLMTKELKNKHKK